MQPFGPQRSNTQMLLPSGSISTPITWPHARSVGSVAQFSRTVNGLGSELTSCARASQLPSATAKTVPTTTRRMSFPPVFISPFNNSPVDRLKPRLSMLSLQNLSECSNLANSRQQPGTPYARIRLESWNRRSNNRWLAYRHSIFPRDGELLADSGHHSSKGTNHLEREIHLARCFDFVSRSRHQ